MSRDFPLIKFPNNPKITLQKKKKKPILRTSRGCKPASLFKLELKVLRTKHSQNILESSQVHPRAYLLLYSASVFLSESIDCDHLSAVVTRTQLRSDNRMSHLYLLGRAQRVHVRNTFPHISTFTMAFSQGHVLIKGLQCLTLSPRTQDFPQKASTPVLRCLSGILYNGFFHKDLPAGMEMITKP